MIRLLSTRRIFVLILGLGLFAMAARGAGDPDLWWHLRDGQQMVATRSVPHQDIFSYTRQGQSWVAHEWLSEIIFYLVFRALGWTGLMLLFALVIAATFLTIYGACRGRPYLAGLAVALGALATIPSWGVRPQMFSLLLAAIFLVLLLRAGRTAVTRLRFLWWMLPLQLLWVNLHGAFLLGPALIAITLAGVAVEAWLGLESWPLASARLRQMGFVLLGCLAVIPLNPNGLEIYRYPFQTLESRTMMEYIVEWASPNFHSSDFLPFLGILLLTWLLVALSRKRLSGSELFLLLATGFGALNASRHVPIFVLVAIPIIAERLEELAGRYGLNLFEARPVVLGGGRLAVNACLAVFMVAFTVARVHQVASQQAHTEATRFPEAAVHFLLENRTPAPIFNYYDWGGYFIARLYPQYQVFIDGRADLYGNLMDTFSNTVHAEGDWQKALRQYQIRTVVVPPESALAGVLRLDPAWRKVFEDKQAAIFTR